MSGGIEPKSKLQEPRADAGLSSGTTIDASVSLPKIEARDARGSSPAWHDLNVSFAVIPEGMLSMPHVDAVRVERGGDYAVAVLYDVSPAGLTSQRLFNDLAAYPNVILCDHHGGAAPLAEAAGRELTGAQLVSAALPDLWAKGLLSLPHGGPLNLVGITSAGNIDPDSILCRVLLESFANPQLHEKVWRPRVLDKLVEAARFGDTTLFGGIDVEGVSYDSLGDAERLAITILALINVEKANVIADRCFELAVLRKNVRELFSEKFGELPEEGRMRAVFGLARGCSQFSSMEDLRAWLRQERGARYREGDAVRRSLEREAAERALSSDGQFHDLRQEKVRSFVFAEVSRRDVRDLFAGSLAPATGFAATHPPLFEPAVITRLFESISIKVLDALERPERHRKEVEAFLENLKDTHARAKRASDTVDGKITITEVDQPLERERSLPAKLHGSPMFDWLREAAASFGDPWLHIMNRRGSLVVSARVSRTGEERPNINLGCAAFVKDLHALEQASLKRAVDAGRVSHSEEPATFLIKPNLLLPLGRPHFSQHDLIALLLRHYEVLVHAEGAASDGSDKAQMPMVAAGGERVPFSGSYHFEEYRRALLSRARGS